MSNVSSSGGRPKTVRNLTPEPGAGCYAPVCPKKFQSAEVVCLQPEELTILRLIDLEGHSQEEAAALLGVSRKTAWRDIHEAHYKIADAIVNGKMLRVLCGESTGNSVNGNNTPMPCSPLPVPLAKPAKKNTGKK